MIERKRAAIVGSGVIGAGWAARFVLYGWDVNIYDPAFSRELFDTCLNRARHALAEIYTRPMCEEGQVNLCSSIADVVDGVGWVQESVGEDLVIKHSLIEQLQQFVTPDIPIASSTSGFKPDSLQDGSRCPDQVVVCHPFNPVYLIPLVEVVGSSHNSEQFMARCEEILLEIGMKPVRISQQIDGHVADRLLEAVWREALWLVRDGVATTQQIDDVIKFGFGPRWAQMGLFETYRIAGGHGGMRHFLEQFGPALQWPWSKLTDVPDMDDELIGRIVAQSDQQTGNLSIAQMEQNRDDNLVSIFRALRATDAAVGRHLNAFEKRLASGSRQKKG